MEEFKRQRRAARRETKRLIDELAIAIESDEAIAFIQEIAEELKVQWNRLQSTQEDVMKQVSEAQEEEEDKWLDEIRKEYMNIRKGICKVKGEVQVTDKAPNDVNASVNGNLAGVLQALSLPKTHIREFNGDPLTYHSFLATFTSLIKDVPDHVKLNTLLSSCNGAARASIEFTVMKPPEEGYVAALKILADRFGNKSIVSQAWIAKIMGKNSIELVKLSDFAYDLENCNENLSALGYLNELDNQASLKQIIDKLPKFLQNRWRSENQRLKESGDDARLKDVVRFVKKAAAEASDPVFGELGSTKSDKKQVFSSRRIQVNQTNAASSQRPNKCWVCKDNEHWTDQCPKFKEVSVSDRYELCKTNHVCFSCLKIAGRNHRQDNCNRKRLCGETSSSGPCPKYHHKMLHAGDKVKAGFAGVANLGCLQEPMLRLVDVEVIIDGKAHWANVLLDNGSQGTFVRKGFAKGLKGKSVTATITTVGGAESVVNSEVLSLKLRSNNGIENVTALVMDDITETNEVPEEDLRRIEAAFGLQKSSLNRRGGKVDMLIGINYAKLHTGEMLESDNMVVQKSPFGWTVMGGKVTNDSHNNSVMHIKIHEAVDLTEFWTTESMGVDLKTCECKPKDIDEELEGKLIEESCTKVGDQWLVPYPWAQDPTGLMDNRYQAERMLIGLEKRLMKNTEHAKAYDQQMNEMLELGFARKLELEEMSTYKGPVHYIPHHSVLKKDSASTPLRIVFNSSNKHNGKSLNDYWMKGPDMLNNIQGVIMRFREHEVALCGDISKMYHRILIPEIDRHVHRYLWRNFKTDREPDVYIKQVLTFGDKPAATMAITALKLTATEGSEKYPKAANAIHHNSYMDDICPSVKTQAEACKLTKDIDEMLCHGGFSVKHWCSNMPLKGKKTTKEVSQKVLGVRWNTKDDSFTFDIDVEINRFTKRTVLGVMARVFDPIGLVAPVVITTKIKMQELWQAKVEWDEVLNQKTQQEWQGMFEEFRKLNQLKFPRCLTPPAATDDVSLMVFCDASEKAFGACAYSRWLLKDGTYDCRLLASKSRVAPLKMLTIPRLELQAAVLAARLTETVVAESTFKFQETILFSDSMIVLGWLKKPAGWFRQFVSVRVREINNKTAAATWRHVPGLMNPADELSRGVKADELSGRWIRGPDFLKYPMKEWPDKKNDNADEDSCEEKRSVFCGQVSSKLGDDIDLKSFERWEDLQEAYRAKMQGDNQNIDANLINKLEIMMLQRAQREAFAEEYALLKNGKPEQKSSRLNNLTPEFDSEVELIRVGGRLRRANNIEIDAHPIVMDPKHPITQLLIKRVDIDAFNHSAGYGQVFSYIRRRYWILKGLSAVKSVLRICPDCQRWRGKANVPRMADVPQARLRIRLPAFYSTGMDCFGPYQVKIGRRTEKRWGLVFKCMTTRAIHIELLSSMTSDCFIMAFRRFVARRGTPKELFSDCGTNFAGAEKELQDSFRQMSLDLQTRLASQRVSFNFNPPSAPHFGGIWEREVKSIKHALRCCMKERVVPEVVLQTVVTEVEGLMNSKPLGYASSDISDVDPVTPNMLLMGRRDPVLPFASISQKEEIRSKKQWRHSQVIVDLFWKKFVCEYLPSQQIRQKWVKEADSLQKGDKVLVIDQQAHRGEWLIGEVKEVYPSIDNRVRIADVKINDKMYKRPVVKLIKLNKVL